MDVDDEILGVDHAEHFPKQVAIENTISKEMYPFALYVVDFGTALEE
ncbi:hypothetical protein GCM10027093_69410 [Paraburkholderia jirisanensis]